MNDKLNKRIAILLIFTSLLGLPLPSEAQKRRVSPNGQGLFISDWCGFSKRMAVFTAMNTFAFGITPGLQGVGVAFGAVTIGFKVVEMVSCE